MLGIDLDPEFAQPGQPGVPVHRSRGRVVDRDVVEQDAPLGSLVVAANPGAAGRAPDHDGDAVELFVAGVEYHSCHRVPIREPSAVSLQSRFALRYSLAPAVSVECSDEIRREHGGRRSEEHTSELQSLAYLVCRLLLEKKKKKKNTDDNTIKRDEHTAY